MLVYYNFVKRSNDVYRCFSLEVELKVVDYKNMEFSYIFLIEYIVKIGGILLFCFYYLWICGDLFF